MSFDSDPRDLTHPIHVRYLMDRAIPGGLMHVQGWANFKGVRVDVRSVSSRSLVAVTGELPLNGVHNLEWLKLRLAARDKSLK